MLLVYYVGTYRPLRRRSPSLTYHQVLSVCRNIVQVHRCHKIFSVGQNLKVVLGAVNFEKFDFSYDFEYSYISFLKRIPHDKMFVVLVLTE
jgi:hypothetical protein